MPSSAKPTLAADARTYLEFIYGRKLPRIAEVAEFAKTNAWQCSTDVEKHKQIATALALAILFGASDIVVEAALLAIGRTKRTGRARTFVELIDIDEYAAPRAKQRRLSAWASSVNYLLAQGVLPSAVEELGKKPGEGIDSWSRKGKSARRAVTSKSASAVIKMTITNADGSKEKWQLTEQGLVTLKIALRRNSGAHQRTINVVAES